MRKDHVPKPTPPARRRKIFRMPGERFATMPNLRVTRGSPPPSMPLPPHTANVLINDLERSARIIDEEISLPASNIESLNEEAIPTIIGQVKPQ